MKEHTMYVFKTAWEATSMGPWLKEAEVVTSLMNSVPSVPCNRIIAANDLFENLSEAEATLARLWWVETIVPRMVPMGRVVWL